MPSSAVVGFSIKYHMGITITAHVLHQAFVFSEFTHGISVMSPNIYCNIYITYVVSLWSVCPDRWGIANADSELVQWIITEVDRTMYRDYLDDGIQFRYNALMAG